jgi:hypothetical protein
MLSWRARGNRHSPADRASVPKKLTCQSRRRNLPLISCWSLDYLFVNSNLWAHSYMAMSSRLIAIIARGRLIWRRLLMPSHQVKSSRLSRNSNHTPGIWRSWRLPVARDTGRGLLRLAPGMSRPSIFRRKCWKWQDPNRSRTLAFCAKTPTT